MRKLLLTALLLILPASAAADWAPKAMNKAIDQTNFLVNSGCSGTLINVEKRLVLTAAHCVESQYKTAERELISNEGVVTKEKYRKLMPGTVSQLEFTDGVTTRTVEHRVDLKAVDKTVDLAVLQVRGPISNTVAAKLADEAPVRGDKVYVVGNPMGILHSNVTMGIVSSNDRTYGLLGLDGDMGSADNQLMQVSAGVIGGNSGGSVYNDSGELVGVPVLANRVNEVLGFAVPLSAIKKFLADNGLDK